MAEEPPEAISRIWEGINSISQLPELRVFTGITSLNLHGNSITRINGLEGLQTLAALNLSSNCIASIENLGPLPRLTTLNLASNRLQDAHGWAGELPALTHLNLAYNYLTGLQGLSQLHGSPLERLELQHNAISALQGFSALTGFTRLVQLRVAGNPCCFSPAAFAVLHQALPQVRRVKGGKHACGRCLGGVRRVAEAGEHPGARGAKHSLPLPVHTPQ